MEISTLLVGWGWTFNQYRDGWLEVEDLGYDACYIGDDLFPHPDEDSSVYDPWTILPAMAITTKRMKIGSLVSPCGRRHPGLFAKMTTNVDIISEGRLIVSMGAGNMPEQQRSLAQPFLNAKQRTRMLHEELEILRSMWTERRTNFEGEYYQVVDAINEPKPLSRPHPEIQLGFGSKKFLPPLAAKYAARINLIGSDDTGISEILSVLSQCCREVGRDFKKIKKGRLASILFDESEIKSAAQLDAVLEKKAYAIGVDPDELKWEHKGHSMSYVGPVAGCADTVRRRTVDIGIDELVICIDTVGRINYENTMKGLRTFSRDVMPQLRDL